MHLARLKKALPARDYRLIVYRGKLSLPLLIGNGAFKQLLFRITRGTGFLSAVFLASRQDL